MGRAWIDGKIVAVQDAVAEAARMLAASRFPLIAGLGTDIAGARAAITLAERIGAAVDHVHSAALLKNLNVMRETGMMIATLGEACLRGDVVLLVGAGVIDAWPELAGLPAAPLAPEAGDGLRRVLWLCPGRAAEPAQEDGGAIELFGRDPADLPVLLAAVRARLSGRPVGKTRLPAKTIDSLAAALRAARYGVAVWCAADLDELAIEMLCGIVKDLNRETRFAGLSHVPGDNAAGVLQACGWMTGLPVRSSFGRGEPVHDPWRFDAARLVEAGEADCALWISAYSAAAPPWTRNIPMIALAGATGDAGVTLSARVRIEVGTPGIDHDAVAYAASTGTLTAAAATRPSDAASVARIVADIAAALPQAGA